jgi:exodeoxyribonuclease-3
MPRKRTLRVISWNVNGLRAAARKGFLDWLAADRPDVLGVQEARVGPDAVGPELREPEGYRTYWNPGTRPGYSGTVTFTRDEPEEARTVFGVDWFDTEGRVVLTRVAGFDIYNVYFPNGKQGAERLRYKLEFYDWFLEHLVGEKRKGRRLVIGGDYNTAHKEADLAHPRENAKISGFLPEEREWMDRLVAAGFVDTFRLFSDEPGRYTWWSPLTKARERNVGWRIDYWFVGDDVAPLVKDAFILADVMGSDHCPVGITLQRS